MPKPQAGDRLIGPYAKPKVRGSGWAFQPGTLQLDPQTFIPLDSPDWFAWLQNQLAFRVEQAYYLADPARPKPYFIAYTVRPEHRQRGQLYWYAYKKYHNRRLPRMYLGPTQAVTLTTLDQLAWQTLTCIDPALAHQIRQIGLLSFANRSPPPPRG